MSNEEQKKETVEGSGTAPQGTEDKKKEKVPESVQEIISKVRQEEKKKLYPEIEKLKESNKSYEEKLKEYDEKMKALEVAMQEKERALEEINNSKLSEKELIDKKSEKLTNKLQSLEQSLSEQKKDFEEKLKLAKLEAYKEKIIREAGEGVIPEMVTGHSEPELLSSLEKAKERYNAIVEAVKDKETELLKKLEQATPTSPSSGRTTPEFTPDKIRNMTVTEYAKHREELKKLASNSRAKT